MFTSPCNEYPLTSHFCIVKLGFTGVYIIFLFLLHNIDCRYSLEPPHLTKAVLTCTQNLCFEQKREKNITFFSYENFLSAMKNCYILHRRVFVMSLNVNVSLRRCK